MAFSLLAHVNCTGVLVPVLTRLYNLLLLLKAEVLLSEIPVRMCLSHGARVCRSTVCLLDELLPSENHCYDMLQGMIAQVSFYWHKEQG